MILQSLFVVFLLVPSAVIAAYYLFWALLRTAGIRDVRRPTEPARNRILILIPAHNEEAILAETLQSCAAVDYPRDLYEVTVIADNCTDKTPEIATQHGVSCWERHDLQQPGKGFALAWAFAQLHDTRHDAFLILDADCGIESDSLRVLDAFLQSGGRVMQANHRVVNLDASPISYAAAVGRQVEYELFFAPKSRFRLAVLLVGSGMLLHRSILQECPWSSHSLTEDTEYTIQLAQLSEPVHFAANAWLLTRAAETLEQLQIQRSRWAHGNMALGRSEAFRLIGHGLRRQNLLLADLGVTLLLLSRPLVLAHLAATWAAGLLLAVLVPGPRSWALLAASVCVVIAHGLYLAIGILSLGLTPARALLLVRTPAVVLRLAAISFRALLPSRPGSWNRTPRG